MAASDLFERIVSGGWQLIEQWVAEERSESVVLDFKTRAAEAPPGELQPADKGVLGKAMSGFANVEGGVLVFGLATNERSKGNPNHLKGEQKYLSDPDAFKQALQRHYRDVTTPTVPGVRIEAIKSPNASHGVVLVLVPQSDAKPHQTSGLVPKDVAHRFFMRTDTDTVPMPHDMLAALFGRVPPPKLRLVLRWSAVNPSPNLLFYVRNVGRGTARDPVVRLEPIWPDRQRIEFILTKRINRTSSGIFTALFPEAMAILYPGIEEYFGAANVRSPLDGRERTLHIRAQLFAVDMPPVTIDEEITFAPQELVLLPSDA